MDISCLVAALFFFTGNLLLLIYYVQEKRREDLHFDYDLYKSLDVELLKLEWDWRRDHRGPYLAAGLINGLAWFFFSIPLIQLAWILSHRGTTRLWLHVPIGVLALAGSFTEWISRFLFIGSNMATQMIAREFELNNWVTDGDGIGWKVLEMVHIAISGLIWFVDAFEWLAIFIVMVLIHISVRSWSSFDAGSFSKCWNALGFFIALLSLLDFVAEVLRLDGFQMFAQVGFWYAALNRLIFLPLWLVFLGRSLPYAAMRLNDAGNPHAGANGGGAGDLTFNVEDTNKPAGM